MFEKCTYFSFLKVMFIFPLCNLRSNTHACRKCSRIAGLAKDCFAQEGMSEPQRADSDSREEENRTGVRGRQLAGSLCCPKAKTAAHTCYQRFAHSVFQRKAGAGWGGEASAKGPQAPGRGNNTVFLRLPTLREFGTITQRRNVLDRESPFISLERGKWGGKLAIQQMFSPPRNAKIKLEDTCSRLIFGGKNDAYHNTYILIPFCS